MFEVSKGWQWSSGDDCAASGGNDEFTVHFDPEPSVIVTEASGDVAADEDAEPMKPLEATSPSSPVTPDAMQTMSPEVAETLKSSVVLKMRSHEEIFDELDLCMLGVEEPTLHIDALKHQHWNKAMEEELKSIQEIDTWEMVTPPVGV